MSYRDDLTAAQARASAAERELADAREREEEDGARLARLERSLAAALGEIADLREQQPKSNARVVPAPQPPKAKPNAMGAVVGVSVAVLLLSLGVCTAVLSSGSDEDRYESSYEPYEYGSDDFAPFATAFANPDPEPSEPALLSIDVSVGLTEAKERAVEYFGSEVESGPFLTSLKAGAVDDTGVSNLSYGSVRYSFGATYEPLAREPGGAPLGAHRSPAEDTRPCATDVIVDATSMRRPGEDDKMFLSTLHGPCHEEPLDLQCSVVDIRKRAVQEGAPQGALAEVSANRCPETCDDDDDDEQVCCAGKERPRSFWSVRIVDSGETLFSGNFADDCASP